MKNNLMMIVNNLIVKLHKEKVRMIMLDIFVWFFLIITVSVIYINKKSILLMTDNLIVKSFILLKKVTILDFGLLILGGLILFYSLGTFIKFYKSNKYIEKMGSYLFIKLNTFIEKMNTQRYKLLILEIFSIGGLVSLIIVLYVNKG